MSGRCRGVAKWGERSRVTAGVVALMESWLGRDSDIGHSRSGRYFSGKIAAQGGYGVRLPGRRSATTVNTRTSSSVLSTGAAPFGNPDGARESLGALLDQFVDFAGEEGFGALATRADDLRARVI